jgi:hypothetical protein
MPGGSLVDRRSCIRLGAAVVAARFLPGRAAFAQSKYPQQTIRLIVPYAPGGVVDAVGRNWAEQMRAGLGTVIVENEGGGGGTIGAATVAHATPDGYVLLFGDTSSQIIAPYLMLHPSYDPSKDFSAISMIATSSTAIVVHPSVPAKTLQEFIPYAQSHQKELSYASAGTGTVTHLAGELFKQLIKAPDILHVPYRGAGPDRSACRHCPDDDAECDEPGLELSPRRKDSHSRGLCTVAIESGTGNSGRSRHAPGPCRSADMRRTGTGGHTCPDRRANLRRHCTGD